MVIVTFSTIHFSDVVITVVVDEPKMKAGLSGYGGVVAAPSFKRVAKGIIAYLGMKPKPKEGVTLARGTGPNRSAL